MLHKNVSPILVIPTLLVAALQYKLRSLVRLGSVALQLLMAAFHGNKSALSLRNYSVKMKNLLTDLIGSQNRHGCFLHDYCYFIVITSWNLMLFK